MLCSLLGYSRQAYYQQIKVQAQEALQEDLLVQEVVRIRKTQKRIGTRKLLIMMNVFMHQHTISIGRDAFFEILRNQGLLVRKRKRSKPQTTFSNHWLRKYQNLIIGFVPNAPNQLWVSDITYIRLEKGFAYLSLITDAYSHKIIGFYLCEDLSAKGCVLALKMALQGNPSHDNLIHHSDRGLQYCSHDYVALLEENHIKISMTQNGDPLENAMAERVNGILTDELLDSSVDMLTPVVAHTKSGELKKRWKNYYVINKRKEAVVCENA
jgi:putative transposase